MSYTDDLKIFQNVLAQSPQGLDDPQLIAKYSQAKAMTHAMDTMSAMRSMQPTAPMAQPQPIAPQNGQTSEISPDQGQTGQSTTRGGIMPQNA